MVESDKGAANRYDWGDVQKWRGRLDVEECEEMTIKKKINETMTEKGMDAKE